MNFDVRRVPFSRWGSYFALSLWKKPKSEEESLQLRVLHGDSSSKTAFLVELVKDGVPVPSKVVASPELLRLEPESGGGSAEICIPEPRVLRLRGSGVALRLSEPDTGAYDNAIARDGSRWEINSFSTRARYILAPLAGRLEVDAPWQTLKCGHVSATFAPDGPGGSFEGAVEEFSTGWQERAYEGSFDSCVRKVALEFRTWLDKMPSVPDEFAAARELASYVCWSCVVEPRGHFRRPAMLMSKNWMTNVWSWDHCFNAMALAGGDPEAAWDQLMIVFDHQDETGALPDSVNDAYFVWGFSKPPIHGWALSKMLAASPKKLWRRAREIYRPLSRWTEWWLAFRDYDKDGVPQYNHGNDSGWDNATVFDEGCPVEGPDLSAYLVIQMETLSELAARLGKRRDAKLWRARASELLKKLLAHSWRGEAFIAPHARRPLEHECVSGADSLLPYLPVVLGHRLPGEILSKLAAALREEGRFLTPHGLATESPRSPRYKPDGYWRGPIWAPSTMIVVDGLADAGEKELAREIVLRFARTCARSGFAENFDALTGAPLCDPAYTWTASAFLVMAHEHLGG